MMEMTQLAVYWLRDPRWVAGVAADCELSKTVSVIPLISFGGFHPPPGKTYTNGAIGNILSAKVATIEKASCLIRRTLRCQGQRGTP